MLFPRQLPALFQQWDETTAPGPWRPTPAGPAIWRRRVGKLLAGLLSVTLGAAALAVAARMDARLAMAFAPGLLLALVLLHDVWRPEGAQTLESRSMGANSAL
jgi:hypothetical protein